MEARLRATPIERVINIMPDAVHVIRGNGEVIPFVSEATAFMFRPGGVEMEEIRANLQSPRLPELICSQFEHAHWLMYALVPRHAMILTNALAAKVIVSVGVTRVFPGRSDLIIASPILGLEKHVPGTPYGCRELKTYYDGREHTL